MLLDPLAAYERTGGAARIHEQSPVTLHLHLAVDARHLRVLQLGVGFLAPADHHGLPLGQSETAPLVRARNDNQLSLHGTLVPATPRNAQSVRQGPLPFAIEKMAEKESRV